VNIMVKQTIKSKENKMNPIIWFLFAIVIPVIVALSLLVIILLVSGLDVGGWAKQTGKNIPVISTLVPGDDATNDMEALKEKSEAELASKEKEIHSLTGEIKSLKQTLEELEQDNKKMEHQLQKEEEKEEETKDDIQEGIESLAESFKDMSAKRAALILQELDDDTAVSILYELSTDVRGDILGRMDPENAAKMTELFLQ